MPGQSLQLDANREAGLQEPATMAEMGQPKDGRAATEATTRPIQPGQT